MSNGRLVFPGPRGILLQRADERLVLFPARAAAGSRGRRGRPRLLPPLPGRAVAVGFEGRWTLVRCWREGESLLVRVPPESDELDLRALGPAPEPQGEGLSVMTESDLDWPAPPPGFPSGGRELRLGGSEPLLAVEGTAGEWALCSRQGAVRLSAMPETRVVAPARVGKEIGLAAIAERELSFTAAGGSGRRTLLGREPNETAPCWGAPWLALLEGDHVTLRQLGSRWGRRLGRWSLPPS